MPSILSCHVSSEPATLEQVRRVKTPKPTKTWEPVPHVDVVEGLRRAAKARGFKVGGVQVALSNGTKNIPIHSRMFGVMDIESPKRGFAMKGLTWVIGFRNSHDKQLALGFVGGSRVFVCDNLAFNGEFINRRKRHNAGTNEFLGETIDVNFEEIVNREIKIQREAIDDMHGFKMSIPEFDHFAIEAVRQKLLPVCDLPAVVEQYREPLHKDFADKNLWSGFNAFTEVYKGNNPFVGSERSAGLFEFAIQWMHPEKKPVLSGVN